MCLCVCVRMYACVCVRARARACVCVCVVTYVCMHVYVLMYIHVPVCTCDRRHCGDETCVTSSVCVSRSVYLLCSFSCLCVKCVADIGVFLCCILLMCTLYVSVNKHTQVSSLAKLSQRLCWTGATVRPDCLRERQVPRTLLPCQRGLPDRPLLLWVGAPWTNVPIAL